MVGFDQPVNLGRALGMTLLGLGAFFASGCMHFMNPIGDPPSDLIAPSVSLPRECKRPVHIFLINGFDPVECANFVGQRDFLARLGFMNVSYGQLYHYHGFIEDIRRIHAQDPNARFALIGFSLGANEARILADDAADEGIPIDLVVYIDGIFLRSQAKQTCQHVGRVVNIYGTHHLKEAPSIPGAENIRIAEKNHYEVPSHPMTLEIVATELLQLASSIPVVVPARVTPTPYFGLEAQPRTETKNETAELPVGWDFLRPALTLTDPDDLSPRTVSLKP